MTASRLQLGAPRLYQAASASAPTLTGVRLDGCAFVGVAPRGPAWVPVADPRWREDRPTIGPGRRRRRCVAVPVASFGEYRRIFGGYDGPGRLPYALRAFFDNGGRRAWVVRITAPPRFDGAGDPIGVGRLHLDALTRPGAPGQPVRLFARSEGSWSTTLRAGLGFAAEPLGFIAADLGGLRFGFGEAPPAGSLLRLRFATQPPALRFVAALVAEGDRAVVATLESPVAETPIRAELIRAELWLDDGDGRVEHHRELGLWPTHPRFLATVLCHESALAWPDEAWVEEALAPAGPGLPSTLPTLDRDAAQPFVAGEDRYAEITRDHFFDGAWDPRDDVPGEGLIALAEAPEVATVVVPDLYHPTALIPDQDILDPAAPDLGCDDWQSCLTTAPVPSDSQDHVAPTLPGLILDPREAGELAQIVAAQRQVIAHAETLGIVALLDAPPGLRQHQLLAWRQQLSSSWAAAYHPWLRLAQASDEPARESPMRLGPAAVAAGVIAARELELGVPHGPANVLARGVVDVEDRVSPARHDQLHPRGINVLLRERDGVRLSAARTLSADPHLRQLSVRRIMQLLRRTLLRQLQWVVFEPNDHRLRARLREILRIWLRQLHRQGAFRGAGEDQAFFVRCDASNNPRVLGDRGELLVEIGVAPAEPIEFIVLAITRSGDGQLEVWP